MYSVVQASVTPQVLPLIDHSMVLNEPGQLPRWYCSHLLHLVLLHLVYPGVQKWLCLDISKQPPNSRHRSIPHGVAKAAFESLNSSMRFQLNDAIFGPLNSFSQFLENRIACHKSQGSSRYRTEAKSKDPSLPAVSRTELSGSSWPGFVLEVALASTPSLLDGIVADL